VKADSEEHTGRFEFLKAYCSGFTAG
jgi:hypothetical protein